MVNLLTSGDLEIPDQLLEPWLGKIAGKSAVAALSAQRPQRLGDGVAITFNTGEAEYVAEGASKSPGDIQKKKQYVGSYKFQNTVRVTDEVLWADEDAQVAYLAQILADNEQSLARALDFGVFHAKDGRGNTISTATALTTAASTVVAGSGGGKPYQDIDAADQLVLANSCLPSDIALAPSYAGQFATTRATVTEQRMYPDFKLATDVSTLENHRASVSDTLAGNAAVSSNLLAVVGDFSAINWGVQRRIGLEMIPYGNPDGLGDLKRDNKVAFRVEIVYGWGVADMDAFAIITGSGSGSQGS